MNIELRKSDTEIGLEIVELIDRMFFYCNDRLKDYVYGESERVFLSMPPFLIQYFKIGLWEKFSRSEFDLFVKYQGVRVIPNYELSIVLFIDDWNYFPGEWTQEKVLLQDPEERQHEHYTEYIHSLRDFISVNGLLR